MFLSRKQCGHSPGQGHVFLFFIHEYRSNIFWTEETVVHILVYGSIVTTDQVRREGPSALPTDMECWRVVRESTKKEVD